MREQMRRERKRTCGEVGREAVEATDEICEAALLRLLHHAPTVHLHHHVDTVLGRRFRDEEALEAVGQGGAVNGRVPGQGLGPGRGGCRGVSRRVDQRGRERGENELK